MKKTFNGLVQAGESLIRCALIAAQEVRAAEAAGASPEEVARLRYWQIQLMRRRPATNAIRPG